MSVEENKATMRRFYDDVINGGNLDLADQYVAEDLIEHEDFPGISPGLEGFKQFVQMLRSAFPDLTFTVEDMLAEGDKVAARITMRGTHKGSFMEMAATGSRIEVSAIDICRLAGGKIVEHWGISDSVAMMEQLSAT